MGFKERSVYWSFYLVTENIFYINCLTDNRRGYRGLLIVFLFVGNYGWFVGDFYWIKCN